MALSKVIVDFTEKQLQVIRTEREGDIYCPTYYVSQGTINILRQQRGG
jgi:hypothetical protein